MVGLIKKAINLINDLEKLYFLIERKRQRLGKPNIIYVKNLIKETVDKSVDDYVDKPVDKQFLKCKNYISDMSKVQGSNTKIILILIIVQKKETINIS